MGPFLHDGRAFAVILPDDDERAAPDPGGGYVGQRVRGHVGADGGFPGHRAAQRVIDRGSQHGGRSRLTGGLLEVDAQFFQDLPGIGKNVDQVADGGSLVAADIGDTGLQQGLGYRENALPVQFVAVSQTEHLYLLCEGTLSHWIDRDGLRNCFAVRLPWRTPFGHPSGGQICS